MAETPDVIKHHRPLTRPRFKKAPKGTHENNDTGEQRVMKEQLAAEAKAAEATAAEAKATEAKAAEATAAEATAAEAKATEAKAAEAKAAEAKAAEAKAAEATAAEAKEAETTEKKEESINNLKEKDKTESEIPEGEPTTTETINITGRKFDIRYDKENRKRRAEVFSGDSKKKLTETEEEVLKAIGITKETRNELNPYLADFFNSLPSCQSSSQMLTNRRCEIAYYIMWSVLLKARQATQQKLDEQAKAGVTDLDTHQIAASVDAMSAIKTTVSGQNHSEHMEIIDIVTRIENNLKEVKLAVDNLPKKTGEQKGGGLSEMNRLFRKRSRN